MEKAILLASAASLCTATASVCQRLGARSNETTGFDVWLVFRLARRPVWLLGVASMILGFAFQLSALHYGELALVQPILALELLFVFGYLAVVGSRRVKVKRSRLAGCGRDVGGNRPVSLPGVALGRAAARAGLLLVAGRPGHFRGRAARPGRGPRAG